MNRRFVDLFAGCGGLSLGLLKSNWEGVAAIEKDSFAFDTLRSNLIDGDSERCAQYRWPTGLQKGPMTVKDFLDLPKNTPSLLQEFGDIDLVAGGPPCQGFSMAGLRQGNDPRNSLFRDYVEVVKLFRPKVVVLENVRGVTVAHGDGKPYSELIIESLESAGYICSYSLHLASEFGVPQRRPRFFLVAFDAERYDLISKEWLDMAVQRAIEQGKRLIFERHGLPIGIDVSVGQAISDLEVGGQELEPCPDAPGRQQIRYSQGTHKPYSAYQLSMRRDAPENMNSMRLARHSPGVAENFRLLVDYAHRFNRKSVVFSHQERIGLTKSRKHTIVVLDEAQPSPTLTTLPDDLIHYSEPRILTVREYARLQSFPDWFTFKGKYTTGGVHRTKECPRYTQIGNAVAPFVGEAIGLALQSLLDLLDSSHARPISCSATRTSPVNEFGRPEEIYG